jgi:hypothetical protein
MMNRLVSSLFCKKKKKRVITANTTEEALQSPSLHLVSLPSAKEMRSETSVVWTDEGHSGKVRSMTSLLGTTNKMTREEDTSCRFLEMLPLELRNLVYYHVWDDGRARDHHIYHDEGGLGHTRCVMSPRHEQHDHIQLEMDRIYDAPSFDHLRETRLRMWYYRQFFQSWGHRHWMCKERLQSIKLSCDEDEEFSGEDRTGWMDMLLVCKQMYVVSCFPLPFGIQGLALPLIRNMVKSD